MSLKTAIEKKQYGCVIRLDGRLDSNTAPACDEKIQDALSGDVKAVVFDLSKLEYICSLGLRTILSSKNKIQKEGGKVVVADMQAAVAKVFEMANVLMQTEIFDSVELADIYLDAIQRRESLKDFDVPD